MAQYDVDLLLTVAGVGRVAPVTRTVTAASLEEAVVLAKKDVLTVVVTRAAVSAPPASVPVTPAKP